MCGHLELYILSAEHVDGPPLSSSIKWMVVQCIVRAACSLFPLRWCVLRIESADLWILNCNKSTRLCYSINLSVTERFGPTNSVLPGNDPALSFEYFSLLVLFCVSWIQLPCHWISFFGILGFLSHYLLIALVLVLFFLCMSLSPFLRMFNLLFAALAFGSQLVSSALHYSFKYCSLNYCVCLLSASLFPQHCFQVLWAVSFCFFPHGVPHSRFPCLPFDPISSADELKIPWLLSHIGRPKK